MLSTRTRTSKSGKAKATKTSSDSFISSSLGPLTALQWHSGDRSQATDRGMGWHEESRDRVIEFSHS